MRLTVAEVRKLLRNLKPGDTIEVSISGEQRVNAITMFEKFQRYASKDAILNGEYKALRGHEITITEAAEKYDVPRPTVQGWVSQSGYLEPLDHHAYPVTFDEAEIAYLVDIYRQRRKHGSKAPLVDGDGLPYELKRPDVANYRRRKKTGPLES